MASLDELLQQCDKNALVGVVKELCAVSEEYLNDPEGSGELNSEKAKGIVLKALIGMKLAKQRQQDKDRNAFAVVAGAREAAGKSDFEMAEAGGRERASTGLLVVGGDVLSLVSTFLSWQKVTLQREWKAPGGRNVFSCHISPCSSMVLTASGNDLHLWDAASGLLKATFKGHASLIWRCRFFFGGKSIVSASNDCTLKVWDVESGSLVRTLAGHTSMVGCVDVSPDNARILSASGDNTWKLWNARTGELLHTEHVGECSCCCSFSPNGRLILVGCEANLMLHDSTTFQLQHTLTGHGDEVASCSFAPNGATILSSSFDCTMKLWSTSTGQHLCTLAGHSACVLSCSFSPSGHDIYSASDDGNLMMWTTATGQLNGIIDKDPNLPWSICASSDGKYIVSGHDDGFVKTWRIG
jgi:WD40 repeat protein